MAISRMMAMASSLLFLLVFLCSACWDDIEMEAYGQGQYDKNYGYYGASYYESVDCDSVCQSILEDAYDQGYEDY